MHTSVITVVSCLTAGGYHHKSYTSRCLGGNSPLHVVVLKVLCKRGDE